VASPAQTEGPYFVEAVPERSDLRADSATGQPQEGAVLRLDLSVVKAGTCAALAGARVDVWHASAQGAYSGVEAQAGHDFLRGHQPTDSGGNVTFTTIYPGWYPGRAIHIHVKVRSAGTSFTSQLYADDAFSDAVMARAPYNTRGARDTRNDADGVFRGGGDRLLLALAAGGDGYVGTFRVVAP
jgi:protocatechuate 3,4-dioxygenase beta subunit